MGGGVGGGQVKFYPYKKVRKARNLAMLRTFLRYL